GRRMRRERPDGIAVRSRELQWNGDALIALIDHALEVGKQHCLVRHGEINRRLQLRGIETFLPRLARLPLIARPRQITGSVRGKRKNRRERKPGRPHHKTLRVPGGRRMFFGFSPAAPLAPLPSLPSTATSRACCVLSLPKTNSSMPLVNFSISASR